VVLSRNHFSSSALQDERTQFKRQAAEYAVGFVEPGMVIGLGTGSTASYATRRIAQFLGEGKLNEIVGFATSKAVWEEAKQLGIPMATEDMPRSIDLTIDGADEVDPGMNLIKGGGGALLREKVVAQASHRLFIAIDDSKNSPQLGTHRVLPVEVLPFGWRSQVRFLESLGAHVVVRREQDGSEFVTDSGNPIFDCDFGPIANVADLALRLSAQAGIVEHGLFLGLATDLIIAGKTGIRHLRRDDQGIVCGTDERDIQ
jgi:ribose 5-phosphate isomerase A